MPSRRRTRHSATVVSTGDLTFGKEITREITREIAPVPLAEDWSQPEAATDFDAEYDQLFEAGD